MSRPRWRHYRANRRRRPPRRQRSARSSRWRDRVTRQVGSPPADLAGGPASTGRSRAPEPPIRVVLAVPSLVVLVGAAGSGKSTLAARLFEPTEIVSSDDLREAISGDASDQRGTRLAFSILHREVRSRIASGRLVVVDATNLGVGARRGLLRIAAAA